MSRLIHNATYSKTCLKRPLKKKAKNIVFKTVNRLMQVKSIAECSKESILQYFRPSFSYHLSLRAFLSIFEWSLKSGFTVIPTHIEVSSTLASCTCLSKDWLFSYSETCLKRPLKHRQNKGLKAM